MGLEGDPEDGEGHGRRGPGMSQLSARKVQLRQRSSDTGARGAWHTRTLPACYE